MIVSREVARAQGLKRFFTGSLCANGHVAERHTSDGACVVCKITRSRAWEKANPVKLKARAKRSSAKHAEARRVRSRDYYARHTEERREHAKKWREANPDKVALQHQRRDKNYFKAYVKTEKAKASRRAYKKQNQDAVRSHTRNRRARIQAAPGTHTAADIKWLHDAQGGRCAICFQKLGDKYEADHRQPLARGGGNGRDNLQLVHRTCNAQKWSKDPFEFALELGRLL